jgi:hypothetical protein
MARSLTSPWRAKHLLECPAQDRSQFKFKPYLNYVVLGLSAEVSHVKWLTGPSVAPLASGESGEWRMERNTAIACLPVTFRCLRLSERMEDFEGTWCHTFLLESFVNGLKSAYMYACLHK